MILRALQLLCLGALAAIAAAWVLAILFAVLVMPFHGVYEPLAGAICAAIIGLIVWGAHSALD